MLAEMVTIDGGSELHPDATITMIDLGPRAIGTVQRSIDTREAICLW